MQRPVIVAVIALSACAATAATELTTRGHAIDADTISIPVRLAGVEAFELRQQCARPDGSCWPCGSEAQNLTSRLVSDRPIHVTLGYGSSYDRSVGTIAVGSQDLGLALILAGYAVPRTQYLRSEPDRARIYTEAYQKARTGRAGAHAGRWIDPQDWRTGQRLSCEARP